MEIANGIHLIDGTKGSYAYIILGDEPVLVDTSMSGKAPFILSALDKLGMKPTDIAHIVLTHSDVDHIGNAKFLRQQTGATLWGPTADLPYIHGQQVGPGVRKIIAKLMKVDRPTLDKTYGAGQVIGNLEVIPAPGHTPGHVCLRMNDVLLAGDLVTSKKGRLKPAPGFLTWDKAALQRSLREVGKLNFDWVCPAHGDPVRRGSLWETLYRS